MTDELELTAYSPAARDRRVRHALDRRQVLLGAGAVGMGALAPLRARAETVDTTTLSIAYPIDVPTWDPNALSIPGIQNLYATVFDSPLRYSPELKLGPRQITEWKWVDDKATRLEITLRDDIFFHDGSKLTMEDVKFSLSDRGKADKKLVVGAMLNTFSDIEVKSPTRGVVQFSRPTPSAPIYLAFLTAYVVPKAYMSQVGPEGFNAKPIGAGPYRMVEHQRGSRIVLEAFDKYWGGAPPIRHVTFEIASEASARVALVESGRAGLATQLPVREVQRLGQKAGLVTKIFPFSEVYMLRIPSYVPPMDNDHVRAAMHLAIDKAALSKAFYAGVAKPLSVMAPEGTPSYVPDFKFPFDKTKALSELKEAGYGPDNPCPLRCCRPTESFRTITTWRAPLRRCGRRWASTQLSKKPPPPNCWMQRRTASSPAPFSTVGQMPPVIPKTMPAASLIPGCGFRRGRTCRCRHASTNS